MASFATLHTPPELSILHLSDLHLGPTTASETDRKVSLEHLEERSIAQEVLTWLRDWPRVPDYVVVTGDLSHQARPAGYAEFSRAYEILSASKKIPPPNRIIVVPGNHDVKWSQRWNSPEERRWKHFANAVAHNFVRPWLPTIDPPQSDLIKLMQEHLSAGVESVGGLIRIIDDDRMQERRQFLPFVFHRSHKVLFYAFNSSSVAGTLVALESNTQRDVEWLQQDQSPNSERARRVVRAMLTRSQVDAARIQPAELELFRRTMVLLRELLSDEFDAAFKIAVLHHHVAPMIHEEVKQFELLLNAGKFKAELSAHGFQLVLHGHKHDPRVFIDSTVSRDTPLAVVAGSTIGGQPAPRSAPGFHWIELPPDRREVVVRTLSIPEAGGFSEAWEGARLTTLPILPRGASLVETLMRTTPARISVRRLKTATAEALAKCLAEQPMSSGGTLLGWSHDLTRRHVTMLATAFGLKLMRDLDASFASFRGEEVIRTLFELQLEDGLWSATTEVAPVGRPEASAYAIVALDAWGHATEVQAGLKRFHESFTRELDAELWRHVTSLTVVIRMLSRLAPDSELLRAAADTLWNGVHQFDAQLAFWTQQIHNDEQEPSVAHTAAAVIALSDAYDAIGVEAPATPASLAPAINWLLQQPEWLPTAETISRPVSDKKFDNLYWRHFTPARVLIALAKAGIDVASEPRAARELVALAEASDLGLWKWGEQKPIWATSDAIEALNVCALESLIV